MYKNTENIAIPSSLMKQLLPKSTTLIRVECGSRKRMFSGLRSQWMMRSRCRSERHCSICSAKSCTMLAAKPLNELRLMQS